MWPIHILTIWILWFMNIDEAYIAIALLKKNKYMVFFLNNLSIDAVFNHFDEIATNLTCRNGIGSVFSWSQRIRYIGTYAWQKRAGSEKPKAKGPQQKMEVFIKVQAWSSNCLKFLPHLARFSPVEVKSKITLSKPSGWSAVLQVTSLFMVTWWDRCIGFI